MIKRIDLFLPPIGQYGVLHHFTRMLNEALIRRGVDCRLLEAEKRNPKPFLTQLFNDPPDCTLSFNGLLPDEEGRFFCEMVKIPHVACLVDSPNHFFQLIKTPYNIITCVDSFSCDFFKGLKHPNVLFMPHAIEKSISAGTDNKRTYDILFPASYIDFEKIARDWDNKYPSPLRNALREAAEITLTDETTPYVQALVKTLETNSTAKNPLKLDTVDFISLLDELEMYIRGLERVRLVKSIKCARIDIFGNGHSKAVWDQHLGKDNNVVVHPSVHFDEVLELMRHSKVVLNSCGWIKHGTHERTLAGLACGAAVLTRETEYLKEQFKPDQSILFYQGSKMDEIDGKISNILKDESARQSIAKQGREVVMKHHTWDQRAAGLIRELPPILEQIKAVMA